MSDKNLERGAHLFRVDQAVEAPQQIPGLFRIGPDQSPGALADSETGQEISLGEHGRDVRAAFPERFAQGFEIHVRGQVRGAGVGENLVAGMIAKRLKGFPRRRPSVAIVDD